MAEPNLMPSVWASLAPVSATAASVSMANADLTWVMLVMSDTRFEPKKGYGCVYIHVYVYECMQKILGKPKKKHRNKTRGKNKKTRGEKQKMKKKLGARRKKQRGAIKKTGKNTREATNKNTRKNQKCARPPKKKNTAPKKQQNSPRSLFISTDFPREFL